MQIIKPNFCQEMEKETPNSNLLGFEKEQIHLNCHPKQKVLFASSFYLVLCFMQSNFSNPRTSIITYL